MLKLIILPLFSFFGMPENCENLALADECKRQIPKKFSVLKAFQLNKKKEQTFAECSYVFIKGTKYNIGACFNTKDNFKIEVYNSRRSLVASVESKKKYSKVAYKCVTSGIYYMRFSLETPDDVCGASLISFSKPAK